jgi:glutamate synthase (NADPH/NADH) small chain
MRLRTSSSHEEGADRRWDILTKALIGEDGRVKYVLTVNLATETLPDGTRKSKEVPGSEKKWPADLVLLAIGYQGTEPNPLYSEMNLKTDGRGNILTDGRYMTPIPGIFAAGDARSGQSIIVRAISEGREAARAVDIFLMGKSALPEKGCCNLSA